ncbi:MAG: hypothetical protein ACLGJB_06285 [Blastocatellia bacterium]
MKRQDEKGDPKSQAGENNNKSLAARFGLSDERSKAAPYLRALLAFVKEVPGVGWAFKGTSEALKELAAEEDQQKLERRLFAVSQQTHEDIGALAELGRVIFLQQNAVLARLEEGGLPAERKRLTEFAIDASLVAYRSRIACEHKYADHRGIEGGSRTAHIASLPLDEIYVMPRLLPERDRVNVSNREKDILKTLLDDRDIPTDQRSRLEEEYAVLTGER